MSDTSEETEKDRIEHFGDCILQHGKYNNRIYLMKFSERNYPEILDEINRLAEENDYAKVFAKIPSYALPGFLLLDYSVEAFIPEYYADRSDALFVSRFRHSDSLKGESSYAETLQQLLAMVHSPKNRQLGQEYSFRELNRNDAEQAAGIYREVFPSYPFPVHDPNYLAMTMDENFRYFGIFYKEMLVAVSSSEIDFVNQAVEMTDFAVNPEYRGQSFAYYLLNEMEKQMRTEGMRTFFTIARLRSPAMNKTFLKNGYRYSGTLVKNTNISGKIESMNVLYKKIP